MSPKAPLPDPVFGGFTETLSLAAFGVAVGVGCVGVGAGVFVFGVSVSVGVGVGVFSLCCGVGDGVSGVGVHCGKLSMGPGVSSHSAGEACTTPDVAYAIPSIRTPAATTVAPAIVHVGDLIVVSS
jgi:hypothetical protein